MELVVREPPAGVAAETPGLSCEQREAALFVVRNRLFVALYPAVEWSKTGFQRTFESRNRVDCQIRAPLRR